MIGFLTGFILILIANRLKETADKINRGLTNGQPVFNQNKTIPVAECVVGPNHVALLLEVH